MNPQLILSAVALAASALPALASCELWYQAPAKEWMEAVPLGNGRLGAMVYGGIDCDRIALNEVTLWAGQRDTAQNDGLGPERLAEIRRAFLAGDLSRGDQLSRQYLPGRNVSFGTHLPMGEMVMAFDYPQGAVSGYRRSLDMENGVATTTFTRNGIAFTREYICDYPDNVMCVSLTASRPGSISLTVGVDLLRQADVAASGSRLHYQGKVDYPMFGPGGVSFAGDILADVRGGTVVAADGQLTIRNADSAVLYVDIRTDYVSPDYASTCRSTVEGAKAVGYERLRANHVADNSALFRRMALTLGDNDGSNLPTDVRLRLAKSGSVDPSFDALFFQYGRYMQIASSRPASPLASNLQGIWNDNLACHMAWTCDYHLDININQNYWSPNRANLSECNVPMFNYVALLAKYGAETASKLYGCGGWCAHTVTNPWGFTAPGGWMGWALNVSAGAWLATELWSHYLYTLDQEYLANIGYPLLRSCAEFFIDYMVEDPSTGYLLTGPSISPENGYRTADGRDYCVSLMPTIDNAIVRQIYTACIESSRILGIDKQLRARLEKDIKRLPPIAIGKDGQVKEWLLDVTRTDPSHRHMSHLVGLFPFGQMTYTKTPELMEAARRTLAAQTASAGWENTEWSSANMLCFQAALKDGDKAHEWLQTLFKAFTRENLMTVSPKGVAGAPEDIFSFDATEASVAGMCEMLLQSSDGFLELLPALPSAWPKGCVKGVCARGAIEADIVWSNYAVDSAELRATHDTDIKLMVPSGCAASLDGKRLAAAANAAEIIGVKLKKGQKLTLTKL